MKYSRTWTSDIIAVGAGADFDNLEIISYWSKIDMAHISFILCSIGYAFC